MTKTTFRFIKFRIYPEANQLASVPVDQVITKQRFAVTVKEGKIKLLAITSVADCDDGNMAMCHYKARGKVPTKLAGQDLETDKLKIIQNQKGFYASVLCRIPSVSVVAQEKEVIGWQTI